MTYREMISKVSEKTGLPIRFVDRVYMSYWKAVREYVTSLPLKDNLSEEDFLKLQPNINIPSIGKLNITLERYKRKKETFELNNNKKQE